MIAHKVSVLLNRCALTPAAPPRRALVFVVGLLALGVGCPKADAEPSPPPAPKAWHTERGEISFYADSLAGNLTANGERYDPRKATCAHRTLPFGTVLKITLAPAAKASRVDAGTNKASSPPSATCVVNDRGPYAKDRVLDVTSALAKQLGFHRRGHAMATLTSVGPKPGADKRPATPNKPAPTESDDPPN